MTPTLSRHAGHPLAASLICALLLVGAAQARDRSFQLMEAVASGQYDEIIQTLEAAGPRDRLDTRELHILCHAYAKSKRYNRLFGCLDDLKAVADRGDPETLLFALDDVRPVIRLLRAEALIELGRRAEALQEAEAVVAWVEESGDAEPALAIDAYTTLALARAFNDRKTLAYPLIPRIEKTGKSFFGDDFKNQRALALGRVYMALGDFRQAHAALSRDSGLKLDAFLDNLFSGAFARGRNNWLWQELPRAYMLNRALLGMDELDQARTGYDRLLAIPQVRQNGEIFWMANHDRGLIAERQGRLEEAVGHYRQAVETLEIQRASISTEANKIGFIGDKQEVYARLIRGLLALGRVGEAFEYVERSRARALVDLLAEKQDWRPRANAEQVRQLLRRQQEAEERRLAQASGGAVEAGEANRNAADIARRLRETDPETAALVTVTTLPLEQLRATLGAGRSLVEYYLDGDTLHGFVLTDRQLAVERLDGTGLKDAVARFRADIERQAADVDDQARRLYQILLAPLERHLGPGPLLLVPHGPLHYLPFAALHDGRGYLLERHALSVLPSASVMQFIGSEPPGRREAAGQAEKALLLGNPDLGSRWLDLPHAEKEARRIAELLPDSRLLLRDAASEAALRREAGGRDVLHLATHGEFSAEKPLRSGLLLAQGEEQDGRLSVDEIYGLSLDSGLVTLSACDTGLGKVATGDDVVGLIRGFVYAGAHNVLASLWKVDDAATAELMLHFYRGRPSLGNAEALRAAQRDVARRHPHPYYWAAFYLTGK